MNLSPEMNKELRKAVKAFNRKRKRLIEKGVQKSLLPEKASVRVLRNAYKDTESLQARLNQMQQLTSGGKLMENKKGVVGTEQLFNYRRKEIDTMKRKYLAEIQSVKKMKTKYRSAKDSHLRTLKAKVKYLSKDPMEMDARGLAQQSKNTLTPETLMKKNLTYKYNYLSKLYEYAEVGEVDDAYVKGLVEKLDKIPLEDFYNITKANPELRDVMDFMFDSAPTTRGIKAARPRYDKESFADKFIDLYGNIDNIIANANISLV